jgi:cytochrome c1
VKLLVILISTGMLAGCTPEATHPEGDPEHGKLLLRQFGCGSCHAIPGVAAANGKAGPPLTRMSKRVYLAGVLPNTPGNMVLWIRHPQKIEPRTAMPDMQVSESHARDMVAYLYTLR